MGLQATVLKGYFNNPPFLFKQYGRAGQARFVATRIKA
jgi:hypothetical protein